MAEADKRYADADATSCVARMNSPTSSFPFILHEVASRAGGGHIPDVVSIVTAHTVDADLHVTSLAVCARAVDQMLVLPE